MITFLVILTTERLTHADENTHNPCAAVRSLGLRLFVCVFVLFSSFYFVVIDHLTANSLQVTFILTNQFFLLFNLFMHYITAEHRTAEELILLLVAKHLFPNFVDQQRIIMAYNFHYLSASISNDVRQVT